MTTKQRKSAELLRVRGKSQPSLVDRHNLYHDGTWSHVPGGYRRRVQPPHPVVEAEQHLAHRSLLRSSNRRLRSSVPLRSPTPIRGASTRAGYGPKPAGIL